MDTCKVTVVIPTYKRSDQLLETLDKILQCHPRPNEIIIHIDGNDTTTEPIVKNRKFPDLKIINNSRQVGPGGGRNLAIAHATNSIIASFDDDSYPIDPDYFTRLEALFHQFPDAAIIAANIFHLGEPIQADTFFAQWTADFVGCGCAYRKDIFLQTTGYVSLPLAYGMEETDLCLRLHEMGWKVLTSSWLRVFHNTRLDHHQNPRITAASIANQALLAYLRYPISLWWLGVAQCVNRIIWLIRHQRINGIIQGIAIIPTLLQQHHQQRQPILRQSVLSYLERRRKPIAVEIPEFKTLNY